MATSRDQLISRMMLGASLLRQQSLPGRVKRMADTLHQSIDKACEQGLTADEASGARMAQEALQECSVALSGIEKLCLDALEKTGGMDTHGAKALRAFALDVKRKVQGT